MCTADNNGADRLEESASSLKKLKILRDKTNFELEEDRRKFIPEFYSLIRTWEGRLPNFRHFFNDAEMTTFLSECITHTSRGWNTFKREKIIQFVIRSGYKDEPIVDKDGKPWLQRPTAILCAAGTPFHNRAAMIRELFKIYDRFDVNYANELFSHFHVACALDFIDVVAKFLELGQDVDVNIKQDWSPLHTALIYKRKEVVKLLLRNGASPNLASKDGGFTPLHIICAIADDMMELFFEICDETHQEVQVDAKDEWGRTPLQLAVASLLPNAVDVLLHRGADLSSFVFPTDSYFGATLEPWNERSCAHYNIRLMSTLLALDECLKKRGYELDRSDALKITSIFDKYKMFERSANFKKCWYEDEDFATAVKEKIISPNLSLHDLFRTDFGQAVKLINELLLFKKKKRSNISNNRKRARCVQLCEIISRKFIQSWALDCFYELIHCRLPLLCCQMIIENLGNQDLLHICLATVISNDTTTARAKTPP